MKNTELTELAFHVEQLGKLIAAPSDELAWHFQFGCHLAAVADFRDELKTKDLALFRVATYQMDADKRKAETERKIVETIGELNVKPCRCTPEVRLCEGRCDCPAVKDSFACLRNKGHTGPHIACGVEHNVKIWE